MEIFAHDLNNILQYLLPAVSTTGSRPELETISVSSENGKVRMMAADGHIIKLVEFEMKIPDKDFLISWKNVERIIYECKLLLYGKIIDAFYATTLTANSFSHRANGITFNEPSVDYPDLSELISPQGYKHTTASLSDIGVSAALLLKCAEGAPEELAFNLTFLDNEDPGTLYFKGTDYNFTYRAIIMPVIIQP